MNSPSPEARQPKMVLTDKGQVPVLHSVPCDEYGIAGHDWVTFSFCQSTLGDAYYSLAPEDAESELTYGIETFLDHHLYEIFGFGLAAKREKGMHNYKFSYEMEDMLGMVLYGHSSKRISVQINGSGCALARKGWQLRLFNWLNSYKMVHQEDGSNKVFGCVAPKITRVDLCHDDFEGRFITVDVADLWDNLDGFGVVVVLLLFSILVLGSVLPVKVVLLLLEIVPVANIAASMNVAKRRDKDSKWVRAEVEFKSKDRYIPLDILLEPSKYFIGAYPCFEWLARQLKQDLITPQKTEVVKKQSKINWDKSIEIVKEQFGKYIRQYAKIIASDELVQMLSSNKDEVPKRLEFSHKAVMQSIRIKQPISNTSDDLPLFVGVPHLISNPYKENQNAIYLMLL